jgi:hypothetical protein
VLVKYYIRCFIEILHYFVSLTVFSWNALSCIGTFVVKNFTFTRFQFLRLPFSVLNSKIILFSKRNWLSLVLYYFSLICKGKTTISLSANVTSVECLISFRQLIFLQSTRIKGLSGLELQVELATGLPDFSWYNIPKMGKNCTKILQNRYTTCQLNISSGRKIDQMSIKYINIFP